MDPHLVIVTIELARRRMTTDRTLLMFSALPDAPVRAVTPTTRLRRLMIAARSGWPTARLRVTSTDLDICPHQASASTRDETMPCAAHC